MGMNEQSLLVTSVAETDFLRFLSILSQPHPCKHRSHVAGKLWPLLCQYISVAFAPRNLHLGGLDPSGTVMDESFEVALSTFRSEVSPSILISCGSVWPICVELLRAVESAACMLTHSRNDMRSWKK